MAPSRPRATITEHSAASGSSFSSTQGTRLSPSQAAASSARVLHAHLALAVVAQARGFQDAGQQRGVDRRQLLRCVSITA